MLISLTAVFSNAAGQVERTSRYREDYNGDGRATITDVIALLLDSRKDPQDPRLDFNGDGLYSIADAIALAFNVNRRILTPADSGFSHTAGSSEIVRGITFIYIPGGSFRMGPDDQQIGSYPEHSVTLQDFQISATEITVLQYVSFLNEALIGNLVTVEDGVVSAGTGRYQGKELLVFDWNCSRYGFLWDYGCSHSSGISYDEGRFRVDSGMEDYPVAGVTWYGASVFADYYGFLLPTEAEWEYAAAGGLGYEFPTRDGTLSRKLANYGTEGPVPVASYPPNPFGLYDMAGNVWEWCNDYFNYNYYHYSPVNNPIGWAFGASRVRRGSSWAYHNVPCHVRARGMAQPGSWEPGMGFRVVRQVDGEVEKRFSLYGTISLDGGSLEQVTVKIKGRLADTTLVTAGDGSYELSGLDNGWYWIAPFKDEFFFDPVMRQVEVSGKDVLIGEITASQIETETVQGMEFVAIPAEGFYIDPNTSGPVPFQLGRYEVTNQQYAAFLNEALAVGAVAVEGLSVKAAGGRWDGKEFLCLGAGPEGGLLNKCWLEYLDGSFVVEPLRQDWPVVMVTWYGAEAFADWYGFRLPDKDEWNRAAKAGRDFDYPTADGTMSEELVNTGGQQRHPSAVGSYPPNPFGLYDLAGNVAEWNTECTGYWDGFGPVLATPPVPPGVAFIRGGDWKWGNQWYYYPYSERNGRIGFRVARGGGDKTGFALFGRVLQGDTGLKGVKVHLTGADLDTLTFTDDQGQFRFPGLVRGIYRIFPEAQGYSFSPDTAVVELICMDWYVPDFSALGE